MSTATLDMLCTMLKDWCAKQNLPYESAEALELLETIRGQRATFVQTFGEILP